MVPRAKKHPGVFSKKNEKSSAADRGSSSWLKCSGPMYSLHNLITWAVCSGWFITGGYRSVRSSSALQPKPSATDSVTVLILCFILSFVSLS